MGQTCSAPPKPVDEMQVKMMPTYARPSDQMEAEEHGREAGRLARHPGWKAGAGGLRGFKHHDKYVALDLEKPELEYRRKEKLEPYLWSDISWLALFICILKMPTYWPRSIWNPQVRAAAFANRIHMYMTWHGMEKWAAMMAHVVSVAGLTDKNYLGTHSIPHKDLPKLKRIKNEYLSSVYGHDFYMGEGDYDSWISEANYRRIDRVFTWMNQWYAPPLPDGPTFHYDEFIRLLQNTYMRYGVYNGTPLPRDFDHTTEAAALDWVTTGYGAMFVERKPDGTFVSDLSHHENYAVRPGFAGYGGILYMSADLKHIDRLVYYGKTYRPGDKEWRGALYAFRSSGVSEAITGPHTLHAHFLVAGTVATLAREMDADHPLRRFVSPFTINTVSITYGAKVTILDEGSILTRNGGYTHEGLKQCLRHNTKVWRLETYTEELRRKGMAGLTADMCPWSHFAEKLSNIFDEFADDYIRHFWKTDEDVQKDAGVQWFFHEYNAVFPKVCEHPPPPTCESIAVLRRFMSRFIFTVTAQHEQTGNTAEALMPFDAGFTSIRKGNGLHDLASMQPSKSNRIATQFIQALTSKHAPALFRSDPHDIHQFFDQKRVPLRVTDDFMHKLWGFHLELNEFKIKRGIRIRQMSPPVLDPIDIKIAVTV